MTTGVPVPWLAIDRHRNVVALVVAAIVSALAFSAWALLIPTRFTVNAVALVTFVFWVGYSVTWLILTHVVFGRLGEATFESVIAASTRGAGRLATVNVQWSILAAAAVALVLILPGLLVDPLANALSFCIVVSAWLVTVSTYAVHYARLNAVELAVELPGEPTRRVFTDYYYLAAQIATTFSSSDVNILTTRARAVVTGQTFISFAFSTFIIALLITILFLN